MRQDIDFLGKRFIAAGVSAILLVASIATISVKGLNYGIDFVGGTELVVKTSTDAAISDIRKVVEDLGIGEAMIQRFGDESQNEFLIRLEGTGETTEEVSLLVREPRLAAALQDDDASTPVESLPDADPLAVDVDPVAEVESVSEAVADPLPLSSSESSIGGRVMEALRSELDSNRKDGLFDLNAVEVSGLAIQLEGLEADPVEREAIATRIIQYRREDAQGMFTDWSELDKIEGLSNGVRPFLEQRAYLGGFVQLKADVVGPAIGKELRSKAMLAIFWSLLGILAYVWLRFELRFSVASIAALVHDVIIVLGVLSLVGEEFSLPMIAALLTIVGYSLNDTIVVFDRVRENLRVHRGTTEIEVINHSINQTLSRTLLTSGTTMIVVLALLLLGGPVIHGFALALLLGVIVGTYSSIYVASPVVLLWRKLQPSKN